MCFQGLALWGFDRFGAQGLRGLDNQLDNENGTVLILLHGAWDMEACQKGALRFPFLYLPGCPKMTATQKALQGFYDEIFILRNSKSLPKPPKAGKIMAQNP